MESQIQAFLRINGIDLCWSSVQTIKHLDLSYRKIGKLPNSICLLKNLESLNLSGNILYELPDSIGDLTKLRVLDISNNKLVNLPCTLCNLKNLECLNVNSNELINLPFCFKFDKLKVLNAKYNWLSTFPEIGNTVEFIDLSNNFFKEIPYNLRLVPAVYM